MRRRRGRRNEEKEGVESVRGRKGGQAEEECLSPLMRRRRGEGGSREMRRRECEMKEREEEKESL